MLTQLTEELSESSVDCRAARHELCLVAFATTCAPHRRWHRRRLKQSDRRSCRLEDRRTGGMSLSALPPVRAIRIVIIVTRDFAAQPSSQHRHWGCRACRRRSGRGPRHRRLDRPAARSDRLPRQSRRRERPPFAAERTCAASWAGGMQRRRLSKDDIGSARIGLRHRSRAPPLELSTLCAHEHR